MNRTKRDLAIWHVRAHIDNDNYASVAENAIRNLPYGTFADEVAEPKRPSIRGALRDVRKVIR